MIGWLSLHALFAQAAIDPQLLKPLAGDDPDARVEAVNKIAALANDDAGKLLAAIKNDTLYATPNGEVFIIEDGVATNPATGKSGPPPDGVDGITVNNRLRGAVEAALSGLKLFSADRTLRLAAALDLPKDADTAQTPLIAKALEKESDAEIQTILRMTIATANLQSPDAAVRKAAVISLQDSTNANLKPLLQKMLE
jgi:urea transport system permease protein